MDAGLPCFLFLVCYFVLVVHGGSDFIFHVGGKALEFLRYDNFHSRGRWRMEEELRVD